LLVAVLRERLMLRNSYFVCMGEHIERDGSGRIDFLNLPKDNMTVTVFFTNGKSITKHLQLSFNGEGNLMTEVTSCPL